MEPLPQESLPDTLEPVKPRSGALKFIVEVLEVVFWAVLLYILATLVMARIRVNGNSMEPTFSDGELVLVNKLAYRLGEAERGDVIIFHYPPDPTQEFIKRVVGLPGDVVSIGRGQIFINGQLLEEPYISIHPDYGGEWTVPASQLFVLGDNRSNSLDSHNWGTVPLDYVIGKALFVYWPFDVLGVVAHGDPQLIQP